MNKRKRPSVAVRYRYFKLAVMWWRLTGCVHYKPQWTYWPNFEEKQ